MAERWSEIELQFIQDNFNKMSYNQMSKHLNRHLPGLIAKCRRLKLIKDTPIKGFKRGDISNNKNLKKPGDVINIHRNGKQIPHVKLENGEWIALARKNWSDINGNIPKGYCIVHKNNDTTDCDIENLNMIKRGEFNRKPKLQEFTVDEIRENPSILPEDNIKIKLIIDNDITVILESSTVLSYLSELNQSNA